MVALPYNLKLNEANSDKYFSIIDKLSEELIATTKADLADIIDDYCYYVAAQDEEVLFNKYESVLDSILLGLVWNLYFPIVLANKQVTQGIPESEITPVKANDPQYFTTQSFDAVIEWMAYSACFGEVVVRLRKWQEFFQSLDAESVAKYLDRLINYSSSFFTKADESLSPFTATNSEFIKKKEGKVLSECNNVAMGRRNEEYHFNMIANHIDNKAQYASFAASKKKILYLPDCIFVGVRSGETTKLNNDFAFSVCKDEKLNELYAKLNDEKIELRIMCHKFFNKSFLEHVGRTDTAIAVVVCGINLIDTALELKRLNLPYQVIPLDNQSCGKFNSNKDVFSSVNSDKLCSCLFSNGTCN